MSNIEATSSYSALSDRQFVISLVELATQKYTLADNFLLTNNLSYFLFNATESIPMTYAYPLTTIEIMENLFKSEVDFSKEVAGLIVEHIQRPLKKLDYLFLAEAVIAANYQLDINVHEQEKYIQLIHCLLSQITVDLQLPRPYLFMDAARLVRHIKFLALRILQNQYDTEETNNDLYFYIVEHYSKEFHTANKMRVFITENFDFDLSNDEISYLAIHFRELRRLYKKKKEFSENV